MNRKALRKGNSMPLVKGAKPGSPGFKKNIEVEVAAGKKPKQAVAISYSESGERKKKNKRTR
jgi:hypothetical protein